jgi:chromosome segregation ATPase
VPPCPDGEAADGDAPRERESQLRNVSLELRNVSLELRNVSLELRNVSSELRNVSLELRNVSSELRNVSSELRNVSSQLRNVSSQLRNVSSQLRNVSSQLRNVSSQLRNVSSQLRNVSSELRNVRSGAKAYINLLCQTCTPAINEGCTRSLRISHTSRRAPLQPVPKTQVACTPYHPPSRTGVTQYPCGPRIRLPADRSSRCR